MSADNGIYILETKDGFRVAHAQAIGNIHYNADETGFNLREIYRYFHKGKFFKFKEEALKEACKMYEEIINDPICPIVEYGICPISASNIEFLKECPPCCEDPNIVCVDGNDQCYNCGYYL